MWRATTVLAAALLAAITAPAPSRAASYTATPSITWLASSVPASSRVDLSKIAVIDSPGRKQWVATGTCSISKNSVVTSKPGRCRVAARVAAARGYSAASSTATLQVAKKSDLNVYAATSLADALGRVGEAFTDRYLNVSVKFNFAGSSTLVTQIQQGAPADVIIAADTTNIDKLVASGLVAANAVVTLVNNKLAMLVPRGNPAKISSLADLTRPGLKVVLCDTSQPCGKYATTALANAKVVLAPAGREASASAVVSRIASGEADAGIAYVTDGLVSGDKVDPVVIPDAMNVVATYPIAALKSPSTHDVSAIGAFIAMARGPVGDAIFSKAGFIVP